MSTSMSDITRECFCVDEGCIHDPPDWTLNQALDSWVNHLNAPENRADALRALLTDECDERNRHGVHPPSPFETCPKCGGRGWLPKDEVDILDGEEADYMYADGDDRWLVFPADWLEAEDE